MSTPEFAAFNREIWDQGARYDGTRPIPVSTTPYYLRVDRYEDFAADAQRVREAIEIINNLYCEDAEVRARFPELVELEGYICRTPQAHRGIGLARFDYVEALDGSLRMVESNTDCPGAITLAGIAHRAFRNSAYYDASIVESPQESDDPHSFLELMRELSGKQHPRIGFIWSRMSPILNDIQKLCDMAGQLPGWPKPYIGPVQDLVRAVDGTLLAGGAPLDVAFTKIDTTMSPGGKIHWCAWQDDISEAAPILEALAGGMLRTVSGLPSMMVAESKRAMALLHEADIRASFTAAQRDAIDRTVARTSRLNAGDKSSMQQGLWTFDEVLRDRNRFVLKTLIDTRGRGVFIGRDQSDEAWTRMLLDVQKGRMVVQEYIAPRLDSLEIEPGRREAMSTVIALYLYGGRPMGIFGRASANPIVNVGNGGVIRPALIVQNIPSYVAA